MCLPLEAIPPVARATGSVEAGDDGLDGAARKVALVLEHRSLPKSAVGHKRAEVFQRTNSSLHTWTSFAGADRRRASAFSVAG